MSENLSNDITILIEPSDINGLQPVNIITWAKDKLAKKSEESIDKAMRTIEKMTNHVSSIIQNIDKVNKPKHIETEFGIKFDGDLNIIIAKIGTEGSINVKLIWDF